MTAARTLWSIGTDPAFAAVVERCGIAAGWVASKLILPEAIARRRSGERPDLLVLDADPTATAIDAAMLLSLVCDAPLLAVASEPDAAPSLLEAGAVKVLRKSGGSAGLGLLRPGPANLSSLLADFEARSATGDER